AESIRRATHQTLAAVAEAIEGFRFNVGVARIYELINAISTALNGIDWERPERFDHSLGWALREAIELAIQMGAPMMPHLAEEGWGRSPRLPKRPGRRSSRSCWWRTRSRFRCRSTAASGLT